MEEKAYIGEKYILFDTEQSDAHFYKLQSPVIVEFAYSMQIYDTLGKQLENCFSHRYLKEMEILVQQFNGLQQTWQRLGHRQHPVKQSVKRAFVVLQRAGRWVESLKGCVEDDCDDSSIASSPEDCSERYEILERSRSIAVVP